MTERKDFSQPAPANEATSERKVVQLAEILDGKEAKDLKDSMRFYELEGGDTVMAGTDKGVNYKPKYENQDRVAIVPSENSVTVVDGMGGMGTPESGEIAADIVAGEFLKSPADSNLAVEKARSKLAEMEKANPELSGFGAVFISARISMGERSDGLKGKLLEISQMGDTRLLVIKKDGTVSFISKDQSLVQTFVDKGHITADEALYNPQRAIVLAAVKTKEENKPKTEVLAVDEGDMVLLMSDGISDNFTPEEIAKKRKEGLSAKELFAWLSEATAKRMSWDKEKIQKETEERAKTGKYSDGYLSQPKPDNRALAIIEIKGREETTPTAIETRETVATSTVAEDKPLNETNVVTPESGEWSEEDEKTLDEILQAIEEEKVKLKELDEIERNIPRIFDAKFMENKMRKILGTEKAIKKIKSLSIEPLGDNMLILNAEIDAEKFFQKTSIKITDARLTNQEDGIRLASYHLSATGFEDKVKKLIDNNIATINNQLKAYIAKETGKKVRKIWIEEGQLKALLD